MAMQQPPTIIKLKHCQRKFNNENAVLGPTYERENEANSLKLHSVCPASVFQCAHRNNKKTANDEWQKNYKQQQQFGKRITAKKAERNGTNLSMITNNKPIYYALTANLWIYISSSFMIVSHFILSLSVSPFFVFRCVQFCGRTFRSAQLHSRIGFRFVTKTL